MPVNARRSRHWPGAIGEGNVSRQRSTDWSPPGQWMGQSVLYLMPPVTSSRCSEAHGIGKGTAFHRGLERGEIVVDRLARVVTEERGHGVAELTARRIVLQGDADDAGAAGCRLEAHRPGVGD